MSRKFCRYFKILVVVIVVITMPLTSSCLREESRSFKIIRVQVDSEFFTFEFPADYDENAFTILSDYPYTDIFFGRHSPIYEHNEITFSFQIQEPYSGFPDAKSMLDDMDYPIYYEYSEFKLLERSPVMIGTITGEQIIFSSTLHSFDKMIPVITRKVYFDHNGLIYTIMMSIMSIDPNIVDTANADFDHILETFEFLVSR